MNTALNRTTQVLLVNKSGGAVAQGDVVVVDTANATSFTTTTTSGYVSGTPGVVLEPGGIANNATGMIAIGGYVPVINLSGTGSIGDLVKCHTVAKQGVRHAAPSVAGDFAQVFGTSATPAAILWGNVNFGAGSGTIGGASGSTDNAIIRADGTGGSTIQSSLATIDDSGTVNIPTGQTYNINGSAHTHGGGGAATTDHFVTTQSESDLSAEIVIPGLAGSPHKAAGGGSDDEFDSLSGWTTLGALDTNNASDYPSHLHIKKNSGGTSVDGIYKACPTIPFTMTAYMADFLLDTNFQTPGIMILEASPGKLVTWGPQFGLNGFEMNPWTNRTTRGTQTDHTYGDSHVNAMRMYLRIVVNSSTNVDFAVSRNGYLFKTLKSAYNPGFTVGAVGLCVIGFAAVSVEAIFDWVRFT